MPMIHMLRLSAAAFVLQFLGFISPGWKIHALPTMTVRIGLWYVFVCSEVLENCQLESTVDKSIEEDSSMIEFQIEATLALICSLVSVVIAFIVRRSETDKRKMELTNVNVAVLLISGLLALIASGTMADRIRKIHVMYSGVFGHSNLGFPYSIVLTGIGGILQVVACIIHLLSKPCGTSSENEQNHPAVNRYYPNTTYSVANPQPPGEPPGPPNYQINQLPPLPVEDKEANQIKGPEEVPPSYNA